MKYQANPVHVEAHEIVSVGAVFAMKTIQRDGSVDEEGSCHLALRNGQNVKADARMLARMTPVPGDYWVIQSDGYVYLNPKEVLERKYSAVAEA